MEVRNCRQCGRLYNYIGGSYKNLCPICIKKIEEKFSTVKEFIEENREATMTDISEACDVSVKQLEQWVREERLCFSPDSPIGIECEICGTTIKTGRYCDKCKTNMATQFGSMYQKTSAEDNHKSLRDRARMRYLDR